MLFPIGDDNSDRKIKPVVNYLFIALNIFIFFYYQGCGTDAEFTYSYSTVPQEILTGDDIVTDDQTFEDPITGDNYRIPGLRTTPSPVYLTLFTSMFMHGGLGHIIGNMLFLLIYGDNIENRLGHLRYLIFYLLCGVLASLAHVFTSSYLSDSMLVPSLGASGAISGVMGGYILLYPFRKIRVLIWMMVVSLPALVVLGLWFAFQVISGAGTLGSGTQAGGVAYGAHIGGFIAGFILIKLFDKM